MSNTVEYLRELLKDYNNSNEKKEIKIDEIKEDDFTTIKEKLEEVKEQWEKEKIDNKQLFWSDAKNKYMLEKEEKYLKILISQRDTIIKKILPLIGKITKSRFISVGSTNLTSDDDVIVTTGNIYMFINIFYNLFQSIYGFSSSKIYDMNLYSSHFIRDHTDKLDLFDTHIHNSNDNSILYMINNFNDKDIVYDQHLWALVHLFKSLPEKYKNKLKEYMETYKIYNDIIEKEKFRNNQVDLDENVDLDGNTIEFIKKFMDTYKKKFRNNKDNLDKNVDSDKKIKNNNLEYIKILKEIHNMEKKTNEFHTIEFRKEYKNLVSKASSYAEDTYYTEGAILHIVMIVQRKFNLKLTEDEYFDSFIENMSENFESYDNKNSCEVNIINLSKYLYRLRLGLNEINLEYDEKLKCDNITIKKNGENSEQITEDKKQDTENSGQETKNSGQTTENKKQETENSGQETENNETHEVKSEKELTNELRIDEIKYIVDQYRGKSTKDYDYKIRKYLLKLMKDNIKCEEKKYKDYLYKILINTIEKFLLKKYPEKN